MDAELASLKELMVVRFDNLSREVLETQRLQRETNGRLRQAEGAVADFKPRVATLEREVGDLREGVQTIGSEVRDDLLLVRNQVSSVAANVARDARVVAVGVKDEKDAGENRGIRKWDVIVFAAGIGFAGTAWAFFTLFKQ
jgi:hypothetical protein